MLGGALLLALVGMPALAQDPGNPDEQPPGSVGYDIETKQWLFDTDGDSFPDLTEEIAGTDPADKDSSPLRELEAAAGDHGDSGKLDKVGFQQATCRTNFYNWAGAPRLCITLTQNATNYEQAAANCRAQFSRLCSYEDLGYLFIGSNIDAVYDPSGGKWLGDFVQDDYVNCGNWSVTFDNDPNTWNFEGTCHKGEKHPYWCCHDRT
jgi:hypothetical protein